MNSVSTRIRDLQRVPYRSAMVALSLGAALALAACSSDTASGTTACGADADGCDGGYLCYEGACRAVCIGDEACAATEVCERGMCLAVPCDIGGTSVASASLNPDNACESCQPRVSRTAYTPLADGTDCSSAGSFCTGAATCTGGACQPLDSPCGGTQPFCSELAQACLCTATSCDDGLFCDGEESCGVDGTCQSGTAPGCGGATPLCSDALATCVACLSDFDCSAPNPSCYLDGRCTECPSCPCVAGEHDGGDGTCVPVGTCSASYFLTYPDLDGDGVTAATSGECVNALPTGHVLAPSGPPMSSMAAGSAATAFTPDRPWSNPIDATQPDGVFTFAHNVRPSTPSNYLLVSNFGLAVPDLATITGIRVHVLRAQSSGTDRLVDLSVMLAPGGTPSGLDYADTTTVWTTTMQEVVYGGPNDLWGLTPTPADVNNASFGVAISVGSTADPACDPRIDYIWVDVFYADGTNELLTDCDDLGATYWRAATGFVDADGDGYTVGAQQPFCIGIAGGLVAPPEYAAASLGEDCYDANASAHPGQTACFAANRGDGSFDYDCDSLDTKCNVTLVTTCTCATTCAVGTTTTATPSAACGVGNANYATSCANLGGSCPDPACAPQPLTYTTRCH